MNELTVPEVINDPMIRILNNANRISERAFAQLMESAARVKQRGTQALAENLSKDAGSVTGLAIDPDQ
ncbi:hypothetical protein [Pararhizobium sp. PWRC1-1]|uniref:hypothetical protein n=1 Tax=Pararhizobium sp. PWRC1-1 TaxID=2804566 RepID=UPI003CF0DBD6